MAKSYKQLKRELEDTLPEITPVFIPSEYDEEQFECLEEGKWVDGRFEKNIRLDQPSHGVGQQHAHVYGRKGGQLIVINLDGTSSHGTKGRLSKKDANALSDRGFDVPPDRIVEWMLVEGEFVLMEQPNPKG